MYGPKTTTRGPGWLDLALCARELEKDYGVAVVFTLEPACPKGHTQLGFNLVVEAHAQDEGGDVGVVVRQSHFRAASSDLTVPGLLYGLVVGRFADALEQRRKAARLEALPFFAAG